MLTNGPCSSIYFIVQRISSSVIETKKKTTNALPTTKFSLSFSLHTGYLCREMHPFRLCSIDILINFQQPYILCLLTQKNNKVVNVHKKLRYASHSQLLVITKYISSKVLEKSLINILHLITMECITFKLFAHHLYQWNERRAKCTQFARSKQLK